MSVVTSDGELFSSFITLMWPPKSPTKTCFESASNLKLVKEPQETSGSTSDQGLCFDGNDCILDTINSLYSGHCRELKLASSIARVRKNES